MKTRELLKKLEKTDNILALSYINGSKQPLNLFATRIAHDTIPILYDEFENHSKKDHLILVLRSSGGILEVPLSIVNLIREYFKKFTVYIPEMAHSAATLIALGADEIIMSPFSSLSPIDPQINIPSNEDQKKGSKVNFSVEDVAGYYKLLDKLGITDEGKIKALEFLTNTLQPTLLGQIERVRELIHIIAEKIIKVYTIDETKKQVIIKKLVEEIPSHGYWISRSEAKELGLPIKNATDEQHKIMKELMVEYRKRLAETEGELSINIPKGKATIEKIYDRAFIETKNVTHTFKTKYIFHQNGKVDKAINQWIKE